MGEMPPSTIFTSGFTLRMARAPVMARSANIFQSGSILKSQCERLFGSFHSITASTMLSPGKTLQCAVQFHVQYVLPVALHIPGLTYPGFQFRMGDNLQARAAQHSLRRRDVRDPPVRGIVRVLVLDKVHGREIPVFEYFLVPEVVVLFPSGRLLGTPNHGLEKKLAPDLLNYVVESK